MSRGFFTKRRRRGGLKIKPYGTQDFINSRRGPNSKTIQHGDLHNLDEQMEMDEFANKLYPSIIRQLYFENVDPELFELWIYRLIGQREFKVRDQWIKKTNAAQVFAQRYAEHKKENLMLEQQIPKEYHEYLSVFLKEKALQHPEHKLWEHRINLKPGFVSKTHKAFPLPLDEMKLAKEFVEENLQKEYI
jgi:hypothetical protein